MTFAQRSVVLPPFLMFISVSCLAATTGSKNSLPSGILQLEGRVVSQKYCDSGSGTIPKLSLILTLKLKNLSSQTVSLEHFSVQDTVLVAKNVAAIHKGEYEPGSRLPDSLGMISGSHKWEVKKISISPGSTVEVGEKLIWIRIASDISQQAMGVSSGKHFVQVLADVEISINSAQPSTIILPSNPILFTVNNKHPLVACE